VNGVKVHEHVLRSGDRISIGTSTFQYIAAESLSTWKLRRSRRPSQRHSSSGVTTPSFYGRMRILDSAPTNPESFRALGLLLDAVQAMSTGGSLEVSAARLLDLIGAVLPITSAGLHLEDEEKTRASGGLLQAVHCRKRFSGASSMIGSPSALATF
jgi:hypothetical protein